MEKNKEKIIHMFMMSAAFIGMKNICLTMNTARRQ